MLDHSLSLSYGINSNPDRVLFPNLDHPVCLVAQIASGNGEVEGMREPAAAGCARGCSRVT